MLCGAPTNQNLNPFFATPPLEIADKVQRLQKEDTWREAKLAASRLNQAEDQMHQASPRVLSR